MRSRLEGRGLLLGAVFFGMLLTLGPWGRVCPFVLFIVQVGHFFCAVWKGLIGEGSNWVSLVPGFVQT